MSYPTPPRLTPDQLARQRRRSVAIALALGALVLIFYAVSMVKVGMPVPGKP
jgi:hypothetical protein